MPADKDLRLDDRDGIQDAWCDPIQADEDQTITWAEIRRTRRLISEAAQRDKVSKRMRRESAPLTIR